MTTTKTSTQPIDYVTQILSNDGLITASHQENRGIFVTAMKDLLKGTNLMECTAAGNIISLDPPYRTTNCSFCARRHEKLNMCEICQVIGWCPSCGDSAGDGTEDTATSNTTDSTNTEAPQHHKNECQALRALCNLFSQTAASDEDGPAAAAIDSTHLLTVRLLCQREHPSLDWELSKCLYAMPPSIDAASLIMICAHLQVPPLDTWLGNDIYQQALARVVGCSHAITDVSLPLGNQSVGRGLFLHHSFYNHCCTPNAFLSCRLMTTPVITSKDTASDKIGHNTNGSVVARLHLLSDVKKGDEISISYISTSGLAFEERQQRLQDGYGFSCKCAACLNQEIKLPGNGVDVDSIREIQFSCNEQLLVLQRRRFVGDMVDEDEIDHVISLIEMTKRGIQNQDIPRNHEVSIEVDRLLAMGHSLLAEGDEKRKEAKIHHERFFEKAASIAALFDPVVMATQHLKYSNDALQILKDRDKAKKHRGKGMDLLQVSLGSDHPWVQQLVEKDDVENDIFTSLTAPAAKKQKT